MDIIIKIIIAILLWYLSTFVSGYIYKLVRIDRVLFGYICGASFVLALLIPMVMVFGEYAVQQYFILFYIMLAVGGHNGYVSNFQKENV